jgi:LuxR family transcriptional regulator, regulator of acetate metabolism
MKMATRSENTQSEESQAAAESPAADGELSDRTRSALRDAGRILGTEFEESGKRLADFERPIKLAIDESLDRLREPPDGPDGVVELAELIAELNDIGWRLRERALRERLERLEHIQEGLNRLRPIDDPEELLARVSEEVCRSCGFERGVLSKITGSHWILTDAYFEGHPEWAAEFVSRGADLRPKLSHLMLETDLVRRRIPGITVDGYNDPRTYKPLVELSDAHSYVCAPIMPQDRVVGFIHADHHFSGVPVDEHDRDALWAFTEGFAHIYERAVLRARLGEQRDQVQRMVATTGAVMDELCDAEIKLDNVARESATVAHAAAATFISPEPQINELLTRRELEVLALMGTGETNRQIAEQLVISEGTVKSHVKHILRKLHASNRAEAVSRYLRLSMTDPGDQNRAAGA